MINQRHLYSVFLKNEDYESVNNLLSFQIENESFGYSEIVVSCYLNSISCLDKGTQKLLKTMVKSVDVKYDYTNHLITNHIIHVLLSVFFNGIVLDKQDIIYLNSLFLLSVSQQQLQNIFLLYYLLWTLKHDYSNVWTISEKHLSVFKANKSDYILLLKSIITD